MLTIANGQALLRALSTSIDPDIKRLLIQRRDQLVTIEEQARFIILQPSDSLADLENELGFPVAGDPDLVFGPEWIADYPTFLEAVWILSDDGYAHVALIGKQIGIDPRLLSLCEMYAPGQAVS